MGILLVLSLIFSFYKNQQLADFWFFEMPQVLAQGASIDNTYAYGTFLNTKTGIIFTLVPTARIDISKRDNIKS